MLALTRWTLIDAICRQEGPTTDHRVTLDAVLHEVKQGYNPSPSGLDMAPVETELEILLVTHGKCKSASELLTSEDWKAFRTGLLQRDAERRK